MENELIGTPPQLELPSRVQNEQSGPASVSPILVGTASALKRATDTENFIARIISNPVTAILTFRSNLFLEEKISGWNSLQTRKTQRNQEQTVEDPRFECAVSPLLSDGVNGALR